MKLYKTYHYRIIEEDNIEKVEDEKYFYYRETGSGARRLCSKPMNKFGKVCFLSYREAVDYLISLLNQDIIKKEKEISSLKSILSKLTNSNKTSVLDWIQNTPNISSRLKAALYGAPWYDIKKFGFDLKKMPFEFIEDITKRKFFGQRIKGEMIWNEFVQLRGY